MRRDWLGCEISPKLFTKAGECSWRYAHQGGMTATMKQIKERYNFLTSCPGEPRDRVLKTTLLWGRERKSDNP